MTLTLPDDLRATLKDAGISDDELLLMTGDELVEMIGGEALHRLVVELARDRQCIASYPGDPGQIAGEEYVDRNIEILRLRVCEGMNRAQIGREVGLSRSRVTQLLKEYFGVGRKRTAVSTRKVQREVAIVQRSVILELLRDDRDQMWRFEELHKEIYDTPAEVLHEAIRLLENGKAIGVVRHVCWATDGIRYLDSLGMVAI